MSYEGKSNMELLSNVAWIDDWQEFVDKQLVLAKWVNAQDIDGKTYRQKVVFNDETLKSTIEPMTKDFGDEFAEFKLYDRYEERPGIIVPEGFMVKFTAGAIYDRQGEGIIMDRKERIFNGLRAYYETKVWNTCTNTNTISTDGAEFDTFLGAWANGGYATNTGAAGQIALGITSGYQWDNGGDPIDQITKIATLMSNQNRIQGLASEVLMNPGTSIWYMDSQTYGILFAYLRDDNVYYKEVSLDAITVPSLMGITFAKADYAIPATLSAGGVTDGKGVGLIFDTTQVPFEGYQYFLGIPGFDRTQLEGCGKLSCAIKSVQDKLGNIEVFFQLSNAVELKHPKKTIVITGCRNV